MDYKNIGKYSEKEKLKMFDKILKAENLTKIRKKEMIKEILPKLKDSQTQSVARKIYHDLKKDINSSLEIWTKDVEKSLKSEETDILIASLRKIQKEKLTQYKDEVFKMMDKPKDVFVLATLISTIGKIGNRNDALRIIKYLKHDESRVRANTVEALTLLSNEQTFDKIITLANDPDSRVKANVAEFFKSEGSVKTIDIIKKMVYSNDVNQIHSAVFVLRKMETGKAAHLLNLAEEKMKKFDKTNIYSKIKRQLSDSFKNLFSR